MIRSMTGFGKALGEKADKKIIVEVRSLNSKQLDLNLRLPGIYKEKELELRADIGKELERGKVDVSISVWNEEETTPIKINKALAINYYNELKSLAKDLHEVNNHYLPLIIRMPNVMQSEKQEFDESEWKQIRSAIDKAIKELDKFRSDEGKVLEKELDNRIHIIADLLSEAEKLDGKRIETLKKRLQKNILEVVEKDKIDQNRFEQELIYYIEKLDITEEKLRLKTHCDYFLKTMKEDSSGRKLGFITQELGREINTIGSKANDANMQKLVVQMKDELEKIKEQLLNVL